MVSVQLEIDARLRGIGHVLRDMALEVPPFQRNYSWTLDEVDEYWYDLRAALSADQHYYFFGTVVVSRGQGEASLVIDGQQRLATTSLLIAAIRDELVARGETERAKGIQNRYLVSFSLALNTDEPRLELNDADRNYFRQAILQTGIAQDAGFASDVGNRPKLQEAFERLRDHIRAEAESSGPYFLERLLKWISYLDRGAQVILMETADESDAFMVFETLNDRGLPLAVADVIKNYLLSIARQKLEDATVQWMSAVQSVEESLGADKITDFIRHSWNASHGATRERDLYASIRGGVRSEDQSLDLLEKLAFEAPLYAAISDFTSEVWDGFPERARKAARILDWLGLEQYKPLALSALSNLNPAEVTDVLEGAVSWSTRSLITGGSGGGTAERLYSEAAVRITNGRSRTRRSVFDDLEPLIAGDAEFQSAFSTRRIYRISTLQYLLSALASGDATPDLAGELVAVSLFPKADKDGSWSEFGSMESIREAAGLLGNWTLIPRRSNSRLPSSPRERFQALLDEQIPGLPGWSSFRLEAVADRQEKLSARSTDIWPIFAESLK